MSSNTMEIIKGISQAMTRSYDGAKDDSGEPVSIGLAREEGNPLVDSRVMTAFQSVYATRAAFIYLITANQD